MATYTTPLRTIIEQPTQHRNDLTLDQRIEVGRVVLFDFDYTMFDSRYKRVFETNFINNFYDREIGFETEHLFKRRLQNWLRINMPYYSNLLESETLKFDPFINSEVHVTHEKKHDETSQSDKDFGETTSKDVTDSTVIDEDTTKATDKDTKIDTKNDFTGDKTGTENNVTDTTNNITGETSGKSNGTSETSDSTDTTSTNKTTQNTDNFGRKIHTDTPDTRLSITASEGQGSVNYASDIDETTDKGKQTTNSDGSDKTTGKSNTKTSDTTSTNSKQDEKGKTTSKTDTTDNEITSEKGTSDERTDIDEIGTRDELIDRIISELGKRDFNELVDGKLNSIENFVQHRYGKIGVQTYSKMLMEYRQTFLRIEREIFEEMNQLFMLVY